MQHGHLLPGCPLVHKVVWALLMMCNSAIMRSSQFIYLFTLSLVPLSDCCHIV